MRRAVLATRTAVIVLSVVVLAVTGYAWAQLQGLNRSGALSGEQTSLDGDMNILLMGLDSRLDEQGNPLPKSMYAALHAGDQDNGGYNSNVLMLLHVPADGSQATSISIPRDDYVKFPGCPDEQCSGKIKQAYGLAFDQEHKKLVKQGVTDKADLEQRSRDAGRKAEIDTVRQFLGGVPVDHFVEVTLASFFQVAQVVQPITVCVKQPTQDSYSGADFRKGVQQINAKQAVAFVRQRRDNVHPSLNFTDLDRERRQQAFISSLSHQLNQSGTMTNPSKLQGLINVAKQNIAIDSGLDLASLASQATNLSSGKIKFVTLPIDHFGKAPNGDAVNFVDQDKIQAMTKELLSPKPPEPTEPQQKQQAPAPKPSVDVVNANGRTGLAATIGQALSTKGYQRGDATNSTSKHTSTVVEYPSGQSDAAEQLADTLGGAKTKQDSSVPAGQLRAVLGTAFQIPSGLQADDGAPAKGKSNDSGGSAADSADSLNGGGVPCVK
ncbi:LCP family protein [Sciscionella sediminilitoris]|uniref:LCP family protein n=1 Tax=Sciscionella sediminilitoris TaxID=1445613 RepID=UPI000AC7DCB2|nr:LCP family protein [Sciscionella sp. SE31]